MSTAAIGMRHNDARARSHPAYWAFVVHRVSGLALALFLPVHFVVLAQALEPARLDAFLAWTRSPLVRASETLLVVALAAHLAGGLRLLLVELVGWRRDGQKTALALGAAFALGIGLLLALSP
jgi:fumarate reductase subunit D